jgi:hypothetical protein
VKKVRKQYLDFTIDKLTNSIENTVTGDSFQTEVSILTVKDLIQVSRKNGWKFNWKQELLSDSKEVYKLTIVNNSHVVQGLISFTIKADHVYVDLIESAPFNIGRKKMYEGVAGNLVAFACKVSFQRGFEGFVSFTAKTKLIQHYEKTLGAFHFGNQLMILETKPSAFLVEKYFKNA